MARAHVDLPSRIEALRAFNRFYTRRIGVLDERHLQSPFSLAEARVLYELSRGERRTATEIGRELGLDAGYLSRILRRFERQNLIERTASPDDARRSLLHLTGQGRRAFAPLEAKTRNIARDILNPLPVERREHLLTNMRSIQRILSGDTGEVTLRTHRYGDMSWLVGKQIEIYEREYGWRGRFEYMMIRIAADILEEFDSARERIWIAERNGERVGSVCVVAESKSVARLRLLLVDPEARGSGLGRRLVEECVAFARAAGYRKMILWTQHPLHTARSLYENAGFRLVGTKKHRDFGLTLVGETWELNLSRPKPDS
jgi:DNA-binding MarR family transcriptional regulator/GNAT superfamily N-acetyltransferase